jgi:homoserine dehydrogenase
MREVGIGLLGFGTVGAGVVEGLQRNGDLLARRLGARPVLRRIADLDIVSERGVEVDPALLTTDAGAVVRDPATDVIIELIGGTGIARTLVTEALTLGKPVVTANKKLLAEYGGEIFGLAARNRTDIYFGASVGGGIPIVRALREGLVANRVESILGILNGTCNYILTRMEQDGLPFDKALKQAQKLGYAEADPSLDIDGFDTAHKAVILASLAYGSPIPMQEVSVEGIRNLADADIAYARELGYRIKLLAVVKQRGTGIELRVAPALVPLDHMLASVHGVFNAVMVHSDLADNTLYSGRGAGRLPTASTVLADVADVVRNIASKTRHRMPAIAPTGELVRVCPPADIETRYYLRLGVRDQAGALASITRILGDRAISIASVLQLDHDDGVGYVDLIITTHVASEKAITEALAQINALKAVKPGIVRLRIET